MEYKIALITLCYNETPIMPFVLDYWKKFVTHAYVFDNGSTDKSRETLLKNDWITIMDYSHLTGNKLDDLMNIDIKNNFWKMLKNKYDYAILCDFDECLWCGDWERFFDFIRDNRIFAVIPGHYCDMITDKFPKHKKDKFEEGEKDYEN